MAYTPQRGDIVKLGATAKELHEVLGTIVGDSVHIRQRSTGKARFVSVSRCVLVFRREEGA